MCPWVYLILRDILVGQLIGRHPKKQTRQDQVTSLAGSKQNFISLTDQNKRVVGWKRALLPSLDSVKGRTKLWAGGYGRVGVSGSFPSQDIPDISVLRWQDHNTCCATLGGACGSPPHLHSQSVLVARILYRQLCSGDLQLESVHRLFNSRVRSISGRPWAAHKGWWRVQTVRSAPPGVQVLVFVLSISNCWAGSYAVPSVWRPGLLANPLVVLGLSVLGDNEAPDKAYDQVSLFAFQLGKNNVLSKASTASKVRLVEWEVRKCWATVRHRKVWDPPGVGCGCGWGNWLILNGLVNSCDGKTLGHANFEMCNRRTKVGNLHRWNISSRNQTAWGGFWLV